VKVWRGKNDPSYVRVYELHGADNEGRQLNARRVIDQIMAVGPAQAARNYGRLTHRCSICGRKLTNALSCKLHIGPVCGGRFYPYDGDWGLIKLEASMWLAERGIDPRAELPRGVDLEALEVTA
jgi:ribosomal protein S14